MIIYLGTTNISYGRRWWINYVCWWCENSCQRGGSRWPATSCAGFPYFHTCSFLDFSWCLLKSWTWSRNSVQCLIFLCKALKGSHGSNELLCPLSQFYFLNLFSSVVLACNFLFFFGGIFVWYWCHGDGGLILWVWEFSFIWNFLKECEQDRC